MTDGSDVWVDVQGTQLNKAAGVFNGVVGTFTVRYSHFFAARPRFEASDSGAAHRERGFSPLLAPYWLQR